MKSEIAQLPTKWRDAIAQTIQESKVREALEVFAVQLEDALEADVLILDALSESVKSDVGPKHQSGLQDGLKMAVNFLEGRS